MAARSERALGLLLGTVLDAVFADPRRGHPVAGFGAVASRLEDRLWADTRARGVLFTSLGVAFAVGTGWALQRVTRGMPTGSVVTTALATWTVLGGVSLAAEATAMARHLDTGDLVGARTRLLVLCGRDPERLDAPELAHATIESLAENTSDAVVAPLLWGTFAGVPGLLGYRAVNTLDAMVGHRSPRHERFGWAAARLDDVANLLPARVTGVLAAALAPTFGGRARHALRVMRRDGASHPSPNGGRCEAAFAGALGVRLGGTNVYQGRVERRGRLGDGVRPGADHVVRAVRLSRLVGAAALALSCVIAHVVHDARLA